MDEVGDESDEDVDMSPLEYDDESADSDFWLSTEEISNIFMQNEDQICYDEERNTMTQNTDYSNSCFFNYNL
jgi:hypothetical protein